MVYHGSMFILREKDTLEGNTRLSPESFIYVANNVKIEMVSFGASTDDTAIHTCPGGLKSIAMQPGPSIRFRQEPRATL